MKRPTRDTSTLSKRRKNLLARGSSPRINLVRRRKVKTGCFVNHPVITPAMAKAFLTIRLDHYSIDMYKM